MRLPYPLQHPPCVVCEVEVRSTHLDSEAPRVWWNEHFDGRECALTLHQFSAMGRAWREAKQEQWARSGI